MSNAVTGTENLNRVIRAARPSSAACLALPGPSLTRRTGITDTSTHSGLYGRSLRSPARQLQFVVTACLRLSRHQLAVITRLTPAS